MRRFTDHLAKHPVRLMLTLVVPLVLSAGLAVFAVWQAVETQRTRSQAICAQVNELRQDIYVSIVDIAHQVAPQEAPRIIGIFANRFIPFDECEPN